MCNEPHTHTVPLGGKQNDKIFWRARYGGGGQYWGFYCIFFKYVASNFLNLNNFTV